MGEYRVFALFTTQSPKHRILHFAHNVRISRLGKFFGADRKSHEHKVNVFTNKTVLESFRP